MILACPFCHARYLIPASLFAAGPRQVRCARCSHGWQAELPKEIDAVGPPPVVETPPEAIAPLPPGSNVPALRKEPLPPGLRRAIIIGIAVTAFILLLLWFFLARVSIITTWPVMENVYDVIGLHGDHNGEGLSFMRVRSELRYDSGLMKLEVEGEVRNETSRLQEIPNIQAVAIGVDGNSVQSWQIDAPAARVSPGAAVPFHSSIDAPKDAIAEINLNFIEVTHDPEQ